MPELTSSQKKLAEEMYISSVLSDHDRDIQSRMALENMRIEEARQEISRIQEDCTHPDILLSRKAQRDEDEYGHTDYSTPTTYQYHCELCGKRWSNTTGKKEDM